jgi:acetoacetyl-CoA synthetase
VPRTLADLSRLRALGSTGSPLAPEAYRWIYQDVKSDVWLDVISGGTDFCGAFVAGNIALPLYEGEMQCRSLGAKVESWDEQGRAHLDAVGELVCCAPLPSMPLYLWGDTDGARYHDSYFDMYPGIWRHGDWIRLVPRPGAVGAVIYGRSDATINRHGIRMGTAELYRAVEALPEVLDALVVDLEYLGRPSYMPLFVVLRPGVALDEPLQHRLRAVIRTALTPRHVPDDIFAVPDVPRTLSGKKMELPVRKLLLGTPVQQVAHPDAMANPSSLAWYVTFAGARSAIRPD